MKKLYKMTVEADDRFDKEQTLAIQEVIEQAKTSGELMQISIVYGII